MSELNLNTIFQDAFGYQPPKRTVTIEQAPDRKQFSDFGQAYYETDLFGREFFMPVKLNDILVSFAVIGCVWKKTFVSTGMPERGGSVKELISIDDYSINIKGILVNPDNDWVESGVIELFKLFKINESITLRSVLTDIFLSGKSNDKEDASFVKKEGDPGGFKVVVKEIKWPAISGIEHAKPFEIDVESDLIFDLEIV